jgi:hypothetical protein
VEGYPLQHGAKDTLNGVVIGFTDLIISFVNSRIEEGSYQKRTFLYFGMLRGIGLLKMPSISDKIVATTTCRLASA